jgi:hypothetical protein
MGCKADQRAAQSLAGRTTDVELLVTSLRLGVPVAEVEASGQEGAGAIHEGQLMRSPTIKHGDVELANVLDEKIAGSCPTASGSGLVAAERDLGLAAEPLGCAMFSPDHLAGASLAPASSKFLIVARPRPTRCRG